MKQQISITARSHWLVNLTNGPTCSEAVKNAVLAQDWVAVGADQHTGLSVPEDVVLLQQAWATQRVIWFFSQKHLWAQWQSIGHTVALEDLCLRWRCRCRRLGRRGSCSASAWGCCLSWSTRQPWRCRRSHCPRWSPDLAGKIIMIRTTRKSTFFSSSWWFSAGPGCSGDDWPAGEQVASSLHAVITVHSTCITLWTDTCSRYFWCYCDSDVTTLALVWTLAVTSLDTPLWIECLISFSSLLTLQFLTEGIQATFKQMLDYVANN